MYEGLKKKVLLQDTVADFIKSVKFAENHRVAKTGAVECNHLLIFLLLTFFIVSYITCSSTMAQFDREDFHFFNTIFYHTIMCFSYFVHAIYTKKGRLNIRNTSVFMLQNALEVRSSPFGELFHLKLIYNLHENGIYCSVVSVLSRCT